MLQRFTKALGQRKLIRFIGQRPEDVPGIDKLRGDLDSLLQVGNRSFGIPITELARRLFKFLEYLGVGPKQV